METNLRPLTLGEILDRTAQLYRSNFLVFAGIFSIYSGVALVLGLIQIGLSALINKGQTPTKISWPLLSAGVVEWILLVLLLGAAVAAINRAVAWVHLGELASIRSAYASTLPRFGRYLWLMTITGALAWLPLALAYGGYFLFVILYVRPRGILTRPKGELDQQATLIFALVSLTFFLVVFLAFVYAVLMSLRYALAVPACVVEDLKARQAIRRSIDLSKGARGRIFVLFLLVAVIKLGLLGVTQTFFVVIVLKNHGQVSPWLSAISQVVAFVTNTFIGPIGAAGVAVFYYDQRVRKEGYDIEWMMQAAGLTAPAPQSSGDSSLLSSGSLPPAAEPSMPPATSAVTSLDDAGSHLPESTEPEVSAPASSDAAPAKPEHP
jgi:uncharacterized membrane protein